MYIEAAGRTIQIRNADKVLFPDSGITKGELVEYYARIADRILPFLRGRPLVMRRYPDGIDSEGWFHKAIPEHFPDWIPRVEVPKEGGSVIQPVIEDAASLVYVAAQGCIEPHVFLTTVEQLRHPDRMILDLDPADGDFGLVRDVARAVRSVLDDCELSSFVSTSGSRGLHITVPLEARDDTGMVRAFARDVAEVVTWRHPECTTIEHRKTRRRGRLLLDYFRNGYAQHAIAPFGVRARPGAPVATPLSWHDVDDRRLTPHRYTIKNIFRRLSRVDEPWAGFRRRARSLQGPRRRLDMLLEKEAS